MREGWHGPCSEQRGKWLATVFVHVCLGRDCVRLSEPWKEFTAKELIIFQEIDLLPTIL